MVGVLLSLGLTIHFVRNVVYGGQTNSFRAKGSTLAVDIGN
jgi:hypothetical protein